MALVVVFLATLICKQKGLYKLTVNFTAGRFWIVM